MTCFFPDARFFCCILCHVELFFSPTAKKAAWNRLESALNQVPRMLRKSNRGSFWSLISLKKSFRSLEVIAFYSSCDGQTDQLEGDMMFWTRGVLFLIFSDGVWLHQGMHGMLDVDWQIAVVHCLFATPLVRVEVSSSAFFFSHVWLEELFFYKSFFMFWSFNLRVTFRVLSLRLQL